MADPILLIRTGGTIDAAPYDDARHPPSIVSALAVDQSFIIQTIRQVTDQAVTSRLVEEMIWPKAKEARFVKNSQLFTSAELRELAQFIRTDEHSSFIITHGTDAIVKNATVLRQELGLSKKVVVFVGAMVPLSMHEQQRSDGVEALGFAIENIAGLSSGVYIVGRHAKAQRLIFFDPADVQKDHAESQKSLIFTLAVRPSSKSLRCPEAF